MVDESKIGRIVRLGQTFTPHSPVSEVDLFAGRSEQILAVAGSVTQPGQHIALFGERGVGKTSMASLLHALIPGLGDLSSFQINCGTSDTFGSLWRRAWREMDEKLPEGEAWRFGEPDPDDVRYHLERLIGPSRRFIIFDEFDRMEDDDSLTLMADTIKALSDRRSETRIVIVGVAKTLEALLGEHESVKRALREVHLPRMQDHEVLAFVEGGFTRVDLTLTYSAKRAIVRAAEGQPHYAHLLCFTAGEAAVQDDRNQVTLQDVHGAIGQIVDTHALTAKYDQATKSTKSNALYRHVLAACALAEKTQLGEFRAKDVEAPMTRIMGQRYEMTGYFRHLNAFTQPERGSVLMSDDRFYRFADPQMQPFAIFAAIESGVISVDLRDELFSSKPRLPFDDL